MWRHEDIYRVLFGGTDFATGEPIADEYDLAKQAVENPPMVRLPIPPMIHGATQSATWMSLFSGHTVVLTPEFDADEVWRMIHEHKVNLLFFTGDAMARPLLDALLAHQEAGNTYDLSIRCSCSPAPRHCSPPASRRSSSSCCPTGSSPTRSAPRRPASVAPAWSPRASRTPVARGSPSTRTPWCSTRTATRWCPGRGFAASSPSAGTSRSATSRTRRRPRQTFKTFNGVRYAIPGDYAEVEADGTVTMLGRGSVSINSGGEKIYPEEVEAALKGHPDVFDALVVGVPDPRFGQHVAAVVHPREGARPDAGRSGCVRAQGDRGLQGAAQPVAGRRGEALARRQARLPVGQGRQTEERPADDVHAKHAR